MIADLLSSLPLSGFLVLKHRLQQILIFHCYNELSDELPNCHVPEHHLKRELPDHVLSSLLPTRRIFISHGGVVGTSCASADGLPPSRGLPTCSRPCLYRGFLFSSTVCNRSSFATATMSCPMSSPIVTFRNAASNASCPIML